MRVSLLEETDFGSTVLCSAARRTRVLVANPTGGDLDSCNFFGQVSQFDDPCFGDFCQLMQDLCRKSRAGLPLATLFGAEWRELDAWQVANSSGVMSVSTFLLTRNTVGVFGFVLGNAEVIVVSNCLCEGPDPDQAHLTRCRGEAEAFCDARERNVIEYLPRS